MKTSYSHSILESKLKRLKISYANVNGKIVIGKPKIDYSVLIGLVAFPLISAITVIIFLILNKFEFTSSSSVKVISTIVLLISIGVVNIFRIINKNKANSTLKTLEYKSIKIKNEFGQIIYDSKNIKSFKFTVREIDKETYEGSLFLIDLEDKPHQILGFDDENERYVKNDLKWFSEYLTNHLTYNIN